MSARAHPRIDPGAPAPGARPPGSYGIDAPYVPALSLVGAVALAAVGVSQSGWSRTVSFAAAVLLVAQALCYLHTTLRGKFVVWARLLDGLHLRGDERVLDVGCGRGMVLLMAARRLPRGRAVGIDLWRGRDQSGNRATATFRNAELAGVADRVELETGDMATLPFPDASFDLVTANVAIQNVKDRERRQAAIREMVRVTRPGGRIVIVDIEHTREYQEDLLAAGAHHVVRRGLGVEGWFGNPFYASVEVSATVPLQSRGRPTTRAAASR